MSDRQKALAAIIATSLIGGGVASIMKIGYLSVPPLSFAFLRFFIASVILLPFTVKYMRNFRMDFVSLIPLSLLPTFNIIMYAYGLKLTTATISQLIYSSVPLFTAILLFLLYKEKVAKKVLVGALLGFIGVMVIIFLPVFEAGKQFSGDFLGNIFIILGGLSYSLYIIFSKRIMRKKSPLHLVSNFIFVSTLVLLPFFLFDLFQEPLLLQSINLSGVLSLLYSAFFATIFAYFLNQYANHHGGEVFSAMSLYLQPIFAYIVAFFMLGEQLTTGLMIGGILAFAGVFLVTKK